MREVNVLIQEIVTAAKDNVDTSKVAVREEEVIGKCPRCGGNVCISPKAYSCADREGCKFAIWKDNKLLSSVKKKLTKEMAVALLEKGKVRVEGMVSSKSGKKFSAILVLEDTGRYVNLNFDFSQRKPKGG